MRSMGTRRKRGLDWRCADADGDGKYLGDGDGVWGIGDVGDGAVAENDQEGDTRVPMVETVGWVWSACESKRVTDALMAQEKRPSQGRC